MEHDALPARAFAAFLFDMDGTVLDSIAAANRIWTRWARAHGVAPEAVIAQMHGRPAAETVRRLGLPGLDADTEGARINREEATQLEGVVAIAGAAPFLHALPPERWALVTSANRELAAARLGAAGLPFPRVLVTSEDVAHGKPDPGCFLLAARRLGVAAAECLAWEDAAPGIAAAEAAGAAVMVVAATHTHALETPHPVVRDYVGLAVALEPEGALRLKRSERT
jgi:sugar-phosphatase